MRRYLVAAILVVAPSPARADKAKSTGPIREITPKVIADAIARGNKAKELPTYEVREHGALGSVYKPTLGYFATPYLRIAQAAYQAKLKYKTFTPADVTEAMSAPTVVVYGMAQADGARVANVEAIVITPKKAHEPADAIRPTSTEDVPVEFRNAMGMKADAKSLMATFPLDALAEGREIHIIFNGDVHHGSQHSYCRDCFMDVRLDDVK